ncbi:hypothetical protein CVT26_013321, partial [Gymnopilus dilepis]
AWGRAHIGGTHAVGGPTDLTTPLPWRRLYPPRRAIARWGWVSSLSFRQPHLPSPSRRRASRGCVTSPLQPSPWPSLSPPPRLLVAREDEQEVW